MTVITSLYLLVGKYGNKVLLDFDEMCEVLCLSRSYGYQLSSQGLFPVPTRKVGVKIYADIRDVAAYLDAEQEKGLAEFRRNHPNPKI